MSELIPSVTITDFKKLLADVDNLKRLKCCEVTYNGQYLFTFINPQTDYIKVQADYMGEMSNTVGGENLEEILKVAVV
jgi:hypothetical protein